MENDRWKSRNLPCFASCHPQFGMQVGAKCAGTRGSILYLRPERRRCVDGIGAPRRYRLFGQRVFKGSTRQHEGFRKPRAPALLPVHTQCGYIRSARLGAAGGDDHTATGAFDGRAWEQRASQHQLGAAGSRADTSPAPPTRTTTTSARGRRCLRCRRARSSRFGSSPHAPAPASSMAAPRSRRATATRWRVRCRARRAVGQTSSPPARRRVCRRTGPCGPSRWQCRRGCRTIPVHRTAPSRNTARRCLRRNCLRRRD